MATYSTNEFKSGLKILIDGDPFAIVENEMVKPGKGQAFNRVRVRNLKTGRTIERTWKSGDTVEAADVVDTDMQYLYSDGDFYHFMVPDTFEQITASKAAVGETSQWLKDGTVCIVTLWNGVPLQVVPPAHMELKVIETDPGVRGDTATGGSKPAKLETGAMVRVFHCSSTKAKSCASTPAPASICRAARTDPHCCPSGVLDAEGHCRFQHAEHLKRQGRQSIEPQRDTRAHSGTPAVKGCQQSLIHRRHRFDPAPVSPRDRAGNGRAARSHRSAHESRSPVRCHRQVQLESRRHGRMLRLEACEGGLRGRIVTHERGTDRVPIADPATRLMSRSNRASRSRTARQSMPWSECRAAQGRRPAATFISTPA